jgi:hypothetical protein
VNRLNEILSILLEMRKDILGQFAPNSCIASTRFACLVLKKMGFHPLPRILETTVFSPTVSPRIKTR